MPGGVTWLNAIDRIEHRRLDDGGDAAHWQRIGAGNEARPEHRLVPVGDLVGPGRHRERRRREQNERKTNGELSSDGRRVAIRNRS